MRLNLFCSLIFALFAFHAVPQDMAQEARDFLSALPANLQQRQAHAVRMAMAGNLSLLNDVRHNRNVSRQLPDNVEVSKLDDSRTLYRPRRAATDSLSLSYSPLPLVVYLHGGGWCFGSINSCARFCAALASEANVAVLALDYPLAPEAPYPAALQSIADVMLSIPDNSEAWRINPEAVTIAGDSAGGNLALATAISLAVKADGCGTAAAPIRSLILYYPVVKAWEDDSDSWRRYGYGYGLDADLMSAFNEAYTAGEDPRNPLISPYCAGDSLLAALPPTLIVNAEHDILHDQGEEMHRRLQEAGANAERTVLPGTTHLFITVDGQPTAFSKALQLSVAFLAKAVD